MTKINCDDLAALSEELSGRKLELQDFSKRMNATMKFLTDTWESELTESYYRRYKDSEHNLKQLEKLMNDMIITLDSLSAEVSALQDL